MGVGRRPWRTRLELTATFEELPQQVCGFVATHPSKYVHAMRKPRLARQVNHAAAGACLRVPCTEYNPCQPGIQHGSHAHGTWLQCQIERRRAQPIVALQL